MYFSDVALGIFGVDLTKGAPFNLAYNTQKLVLGGIDALYWYNGTLNALQGGMEPQRVLRLKLSDDGHTIVSAMPLDAAQPAFDALTTGTVVGDDLYFIANSQKDLYSNLGVLDRRRGARTCENLPQQSEICWDEKGVVTTPAAAPAVAAPTKELADADAQAPLESAVVTPGSPRSAAKQ